MNAVRSRSLALRIVCVVVALTPLGLVVAARVLGPSEEIAVQGEPAIGATCTDTVNGDVSLLDRADFASYQWVILSRPTFELDEARTGEWRAEAADLAPMLPPAMAEYVSAREAYRVHFESAEPLYEPPAELDHDPAAGDPTSGSLITDQLTRADIEALSPDAVAVMYNVEPSGLSVIETAIALSGEQATFVGFCAETLQQRHFGDVPASAPPTDTAESPETADSELPFPSDYQASANLVREQLLESGVDELRREAAVAEWAALPADQRSLIDHRALVPADVQSRVVVTTVEFDLPASWLGREETLCFRTETAWAGCTSLQAVDQSTGRLAPLRVPVIDGETVEMVFNTPDAPFVSSEIVPLGTFEARLARGATAIVAHVSGALPTEEARSSGPSATFERR